MATKASTSNNIKIHFRAQGEKELQNAIRILSQATNELKHSQRQLAASMGLTDKEQKKLIASGQLAMRNQRNMNAAAASGSMTFSVFRSKLLLASFAVGLFAASIGKLIKAFADQESSEKRIDAALKSTRSIAGLTRNDITELTASMEKQGVVADEVNNKVAAILLTFTNIRGEAFEKTMHAANNMAISISGGIPTFEQLKSSALQLGKALQDPAGQLGSLSRSGFTFTGTQKEMIKKLVEQNKLMEAQAIILEAAETQYGGLSEEVAKTAEGAYAQLNNALITLMELMGAEIASETTEFAKTMKDIVITLQENVDKIIALGLALRDTAIQYVVLTRGVWLAQAAIKAYNVGLSTAMIRQAGVTMGLTVLFSANAMYYMRQQLLNQSVDDGSDAFNDYSGSTQTVAEALDELKEKQKAARLELIYSKELIITNMQIEHASLLDLTTAEVAQLIAKKRQIMIDQELAKLSEEDQKKQRAGIILLVDKKIKYENYITAMKAGIKVLEDNLKAEEDYQKMLADMDALRMSNMANDARMAILRKELSDEEKQDALDRIDRFMKLDTKMRQLNLGSLDLSEAFLESGMSLREMSNVMFQTNSDMDRYIQLLIQDILLTGEVTEATKELGKEIKKTGDEAMTAAENFQHMAGIGIQAFTGFSGAYTNLTNERKQRDIEALKETQAFEEATQEQREIMIERVNQKHRKDARKAFQMEKAAQIAQAIISTHEAYNKALPNIPLATLVAALGAGQVAAIAATPAPKFAVGGSFITSGATPMIVGESGAEKVSIQPLAGQKKKAASSGGGNITINISAPLVDDTIVDVIIPKIKEAAKLNLA